MGLGIPRLEFDGGPPKPDFYVLTIGHGLTPEEREKEYLIFTVENIDDIADDLRAHYPEESLTESTLMGISMVHTVDPDGRIVVFMQDLGMDIYD